MTKSMTGDLEQIKSSKNLDQGTQECLEEFTNILRDAGGMCCCYYYVHIPWVQHIYADQFIISCLDVSIFDSYNLS
jgi:hypothetical protein